METSEVVWRLVAENELTNVWNLFFRQSKFMLIFGR